MKYTTLISVAIPLAAAQSKEECFSSSYYLPTEVIDVESRCALFWTKTECIDVLEGDLFLGNKCYKWDSNAALCDGGCKVWGACAPASMTQACQAYKVSKSTAEDLEQSAAYKDSTKDLAR